MSQQKYILTVTLNPAIDLSFVVPHGKRKRMHRLRGDWSAGGKGLNVARSLKALRVPVLTCGIMGKDNARLLCRRLDQERIPHDFLRVPGKVRSNFTFVDAKTNERQAIAANII